MLTLTKNLKNDGATLPAGRGARSNRGARIRHGAACEPVRTALGGTGSLCSHGPGNVKACESGRLRAASRGALPDSHRPATEAGAARRP
jgi:hypothetical protein